MSSSLLLPAGRLNIVRRIVLGLVAIVCLSFTASQAWAEPDPGPTNPGCEYCGSTECGGECQNCPNCGGNPCFCPPTNECATCHSDPCSCPQACQTCGNSPCTCGLCQTCGNDPCTCGNCAVCGNA